MNVNKAKFKRLLKDGHATFFANEVKNGYFWWLYLDNIYTFNQMVNHINKEIKRNPQNTTGKMIYMLSRARIRKTWLGWKVLWVGLCGWTPSKMCYNNYYFLLQLFLFYLCLYVIFDFFYFIFF